MRMKDWMIALCWLPAAAAGVQAQGSLWDRRDPGFTYLFHDYRARSVGDVLTVVIEETTGLDAQETRQMGKATTAGMTLNGSGSSQGLLPSNASTATTGGLAGLLSSFAYALDLESSSQRTFNGNNNSTIGRKFTDRMSFIVVYVLPNGNLVVEGCRQQVVSREKRTLRIMGIVRPADIGPNNTVQSQFVANLRFNYEGKGPESSFTNQGWGGRIFNKLWPF